jgi:hypothetical protein
VVELKRFSYGRSREIQPHTREGGAGEEVGGTSRRGGGELAPGAEDLKPGRARTMTDRGKRMGLETGLVPCKPLSSYHWRRTRIRARGPHGGSRRMTPLVRFSSLARRPHTHARIMTIQNPLFPSMLSAVTTIFFRTDSWW